jgi:2-methylcitrate dehydratase
MEVVEDERYSEDYLDPDKLSIANAVQVHFEDGSSTEKVEVEYPIGHRQRREEGIPLLEEKFSNNLKTRFPARRSEEVLDLCLDGERLAKTPVNEFMELLVI